MGNLLYTHSDEDLIRVVRLVGREFLEMKIISNDSDKSDPQMQELISQRECAKFLGISVGTLISWRKDGKVPFMKMGRTILYSKKQILQSFENK